MTLVRPGDPLDAGPAALIGDDQHTIILLREGETVTAQLVDLINRLLSAA